MGNFGALPAISECWGFPLPFVLYGQQEKTHYLCLLASDSLWQSMLYLTICLFIVLQFKSRGCLGCCTKPPLVISVDEPSKGLKIQGQRVKKRSLTDNFWSISSGEMDNSSFPSHRSISLISTSYQTLDTHSNAGSTSNPSEFVNHGLLLWNQTRNQWIGNKGSEKRVQTQEPKLCWNATYESLLGTSKPFAQPIPLAEMVDFLVDVWQQEGLYD